MASLPPQILNDFGEPIDPPPEPPTFLTHLKVFLRKICGFLFSHIGLLGLVVGYCFMGAAIFENLELENEKFIKRNMTLTRKLMTEELWDITEQKLVLDEKNWTETVTKRLIEFETDLIRAMKEKGWDGSEDTEIVNWTFGGSLFYSITVITTIGYGHIAPKTAGGKIVTIFYAILGIPLTVLCWSNIGDAMANGFRFCYWRIFCYLCTRKPKRRRRRHMSRRSRSLSRRPSHMSPSREPSRGRSIRRSQRTSQKSDTDTVKSEESSLSFSLPDQPETHRFFEENTILEEESIDGSSNSNIINNNNNNQDDNKGKKDFELDNVSPQVTLVNENNTPIKKESAASRFTRGLGLRRSLRESQKSQKSTHSASSDPGLVQTTPGSPHQGGPGAPIIFNSRPPPMRHISAPSGIRLHPAHGEEWLPEHAPVDPYYYNDDYMSDEEEDYSTKNVPIWLSLCLVVAYIVWGAFIFTSWESDWSLLNAGYFCFISLTTIGFGDLVPSQHNQERLALCSLYLLFGIAMIAMSFNLVQEQVINNVKTLGRQCGILKDEDEDEEY